MGFCVFGQNAGVDEDALTPPGFQRVLERGRIASIDKPEFVTASADILGGSRDSVRTHGFFRNKHDFPFHLLSDSAESLCNQFDVIHEKKLYGRTYMGIERSTFLIDEEGILRQEWRKVRVPGHVEAVLEAVKSLA